MPPAACHGWITTSTFNKSILPQWDQTLLTRLRANATDRGIEAIVLAAVQTMVIRQVPKLRST